MYAQVWGSRVEGSKAGAGLCVGDENQRRQTRVRVARRGEGGVGAGPECMKGLRRP